MATRTLGTLRAMLYVRLRPYKLDQEAVPLEAANDYINLGFEVFAADVGGITAFIQTGLVADQEEYELPDYVTGVSKATVYDASGNKVRELKKVNPSRIMNKTGAYSAATPIAFAFIPSQSKDGDRAKPTLRLFPANSTAVSNGLHIYAERLPDRMTDKAAIPDMADGVSGVAALAYATYIVTGNDKFYAEYLRLKAVYLRSRGRRMPVLAHSPAFVSSNA